MRITLNFTICCLIYFTISACQKRKVEQNQGFIQFTQLFEEMKVDTLPTFFWSNRSFNQSQKGKVITDTLLYQALDTAICCSKWAKYIYANELFAISKFQFAKDVLGFIIRRQEGTNFQKSYLILYDENTQQTLLSEELMEYDNSESSSTVKQSWLLDINEDNYFDIVTRFSGDYLMPKKIEFEGDADFYNLSEDTLYAKVWNGKEFIDYHLANNEQNKSRFQLYRITFEERSVYHKSVLGHN